MLERAFGVKRNHAGKRCVRARETGICRCHFAHGCLAEPRRRRCTWTDIGVTIFSGCVFLSMVYVSELGESGESLRNSAGRYPRALVVSSRERKRRSGPPFADSKMQNWYSVPRFLTLRGSFMPSRSMRNDGDKYSMAEWVGWKLTTSKTF